MYTSFTRVKGVFGKSNERLDVNVATLHSLFRFSTARQTHLLSTVNSVSNVQRSYGAEFPGYCGERSDFAQNRRHRYERRMYRGPTEFCLDLSEFSLQIRGTRATIRLSIPEKDLPHFSDAVVNVGTAVRVPVRSDRKHGQPSE